MGLGTGIAGMNFKKQSFADKIPAWLKVEVNPGKTKKNKKSRRIFNLGFRTKLDKTEKVY